MHEVEKLAEAEYFYSRMRSFEGENNREEFRFNLSAFLSAARSVLQYALEDARTKTGGQQWYADSLSTHPTLRFFKNKRDAEIHERPVSVKHHINVNITTTGRDIAPVSHVVRSPDGENKSQDSDSSLQPSSSSPASVSVKSHFFFDDWPDEEVPIACRKYLDAVRDVVNDGKGKGFLS